MVDAENNGPRPYRRFHLGINTQILRSLSGATVPAFITSILAEIEQIADIRYGLAHLMAHDKSAFSYFEDIPYTNNT